MPITETTVETPCIGICRMEPAREVCAGCGRTLHEIGGWLGFDARERRRIMASLPARLLSLRSRL